jgi:hypothetical protein
LVGGGSNVTKPTVCEHLLKRTGFVAVMALAEQFVPSLPRLSGESGTDQALRGGTIGSVLSFAVRLGYVRLLCEVYSRRSQGFVRVENLYWRSEAVEPHMRVTPWRAFVFQTTFPSVSINNIDVAGDESMLYSTDGLVSDRGCESANQALTKCCQQTVNEVVSRSAHNILPTLTNAHLHLRSERRSMATVAYGSPMVDMFDICTTLPCIKQA